MEYRRKCAVCGKIYCYTDKDIRDNNLNSISASVSTLGAAASLFGGTRLDTYALNSQADRYSSKVINFEQCPNCHSMSTVLLTDEEWAELQKQSESSGGIVVKTIEINPNATVESLLKRAYLFLEDAEWQTADAYFEKILDVEPENAQAYLGKLLAELHLSTIPQLQMCDKEFEKSANWQKALRFADEKLSTELQQYISERIYRMGISTKMVAQSEADYKAAAEYFNQIAGFRDADQLAEQCLILGENEAKYKQAVALQEQDTKKSLEQAIEFYEAISPYKNSTQNAETCRKRIPVLQEELRQKRISEEKRQLADVAANKRNKIVAVSSGIVAVLVIIIAVVITQMIIPASRYQEAEELLRVEDYNGAIDIFESLGTYKDAHEQSVVAKIKKNGGEVISAGNRFTVALKEDGSVIAIGNSSQGQCDVSSWINIVSVSAGGYHTIGLKSNGSVVAVGSNDSGQCDVADWMDIAAISAGYQHTVGLRANGTVVAVGSNEYGQCNVSEWTDIIAITAGKEHTVGLKSDGTVIATEYTGNFYDGRCDVSVWTDIIEISAGARHTVGLKSDGTVLAVGQNSGHTLLGRNNGGQCDVLDWENIVAISAGDYHTVGLKADGTTCAVGNNYYNQCEIRGWTDVVSISAGEGHTIGLKSDGTMIAAGNYNNAGNVSDWSNIKMPIQ